MEPVFAEHAHLMCPHMNFGIVLAVPSPFDEAGIWETMTKISDAYPVLNALLGYEGDGMSMVAALQKVRRRSFC